MVIGFLFSPSDFVAELGKSFVHFSGDMSLRWSYYLVFSMFGELIFGLCVHWKSLVENLCKELVPWELWAHQFLGKDYDKIGACAVLPMGCVGL